MTYTILLYDRDLTTLQFTFPSRLMMQKYFEHGKVRSPNLMAPWPSPRSLQSILVQLWDRTVWQSKDEGYTWGEAIPGERILSIWIHPYDNKRVHLLTDTDFNYFTTDGGHSWGKVSPPLQQLSYGSGRLSFHPTHPEYLIWTGDADCHVYNEGEQNCHVESYVSFDNGQTWRLIETYVWQCVFTETFTFEPDDDGILCSSYQNKTGHQHRSYPGDPLELVIGQDWYENKRTLFDHIIGFEVFGDYLMVAALASDTYALDLQISRAGQEFVPAKLPPGIRLRTRVCLPHVS